MTNPPLISIITPSFNSEKHIEKSIISVLRQGYSNFEHIICDGGSTDGTIEILKKYPHLVWVSELDEGQSHALNKGFLKAKGEWIGWLNSDEEYLPGSFNHFCKLMKNQNYDILYGDIHLQYLTGKSKIVRGIKHSPNLILFKQYIATNFFIKREFIEDLLFIDQNLHFCMDKDWFFRLEKSGRKFYYSKFPVIVANYDQSSKSVAFREKQKEESKLIILKYYFNGNKLLFNILFWPVKYFYDVKWKISLIKSIV